MDYVVDRFHDRSLALAQSREEVEELDLVNKSDASNEEKCDRHYPQSIHPASFPFSPKKLTRQGTYRVRKNRVIPSIVDQQETLQSLTQSTMAKRKLIDQATRKMKEAESQAQDLSINIQ